MKQQLTTALALTACLAFFACSNDGPAEEAGENIDEAADDVGDAVEDVVEEIDG